MKGTVEQIKKAQEIKASRLNDINAELSRGFSSVVTHERWVNGQKTLSRIISAEWWIKTENIKTSRLIYQAATRSLDHIGPLMEVTKAEGVPEEKLPEELERMIRAAIKRGHDPDTCLVCRKNRIICRKPNFRPSLVKADAYRCFTGSLNPVNYMIDLKAFHT